MDFLANPIHSGAGTQAKSGVMSPPVSLHGAPAVCGALCRDRCGRRGVCSVEHCTGMGVGDGAQRPGS